MQSNNTSGKKKWHVIYTRSRCEKKVAAELLEKEIEYYLPVQKRLRQWKDRKKWIEFPVISGYCFVYISRFEYEDVLKLNNVVSYLTFEGKPAIVREDEISALKIMLLQPDEVTISHDHYEKGEEVEITGGPLEGSRGELVEIRGKKKFLVRLEQINTIVYVEILNEHLKAVVRTLKTQG